ncbi:MAG: hypothetical protein FJ096_15510, partial [Deltaproteobacteria bacterium]|nr:hypothetical protein [Deltaproteobacteria bacterium]
LAVAGFAFALAPRTTYPSVAVGLSLLGCSNASTPAGALAFALGTFALAVGAGKDDTAAANREIEPPEDRSLLAPGGGAD